MGVKHSIPSSEGFDEIFAKPDFKTHSKHFLLLAKKNIHGRPRIGVAVRKKDIKLAVNRNKIKRKIKGGFLANALNLSAADYVVLVKKNIPEMNKVITEEINEIWKKQNLIDVKTPSFLNVYLEIGNINNLQKLQAALNKIDIIENHNVLELTKNYAKISIKYLGKIDKIKLKFIEQKIDINIQDNEWKLKLS